MIEHGLKHGGHQVGGVDFFPFNDFEKDLRIEGGQDDHGVSPVKRDQYAADPGDMVHGDIDQQGAGMERVGIGKGRSEICMGDHGPLGQAGRPARVEDAGNISIIHGSGVEKFVGL